MIVDTHHHFWRYDPADFGWVPEEMGMIRRDFGPGELETVLRENGVGAVVSVQARQSVEETETLLAIAKEHAFVAGVVGWLPIASEALPGMLDGREEKLVGLRHVVQGEAAGFLEREDFNRGIRELTTRGLVYDVLVVERQLEEVVGFVDRHPGQRFVLDHLGKPRNDRREMEPWGRWMRELGQRENVSCKVSGGVTECDLGWTAEGLRPYLDVALEAFGAGRLMFGSNWPVTEAAGGYGKWLGFVREWAGALSEGERQALFSGTAIRVYGLKL